MANTSAIWQQAAHTTNQLSSPSCSTRAVQKNLILNEKYLSFLEKSQENGPLAEKWQDRKSKRTRRKKTREEIGKGNQMTALRFQTGGKHQTSPASLWGPPTTTHTNAHIWCCNPPPPNPNTHTYIHENTHTHMKTYTHTHMKIHTHARVQMPTAEQKRSH